MDNDSYFFVLQFNRTVGADGPAGGGDEAALQKHFREQLYQHCEKEGVGGLFNIVNTSVNKNGVYSVIVRFERSLAEDLEVVQGELPDEEDETVRNIALKGQFDREMKSFTSDYQILSGPDFPKEYEQDEE